MFYLCKKVLFLEKAYFVEVYTYISFSISIW